MEGLKQAALCALLEELEVLFNEDSGATEYEMARGNAATCIELLNQIGMPEDAELPEGGMVALGMNSVEIFVVKRFRTVGEDAQSEILNILQNRAGEKMKF